MVERDGFAPARNCRHPTVPAARGFDDGGCDVGPFWGLLSGRCSKGHEHHPLQPLRPCEDPCADRPALTSNRPPLGNVLQRLLNGRGGIDLRAARAAPQSSPAFAPAGAPASGSTPSESPPVSSLALNGRGGIRTHAGRCPHDFQSCALSHSATRPSKTGTIGAPGFEPGTSATRTQRSTGLSHAP